MKNMFFKWLLVFVLNIGMATSTFSFHGNSGGQVGVGQHVGSGYGQQGSSWWSRGGNLNSDGVGSNGEFIGVGPEFYLSNKYYRIYYQDEYITCALILGHRNVRGTWVPAHRVCWY